MCYEMFTFYIFIVRDLAKPKEKWYYYMLIDYVEEIPYEHQNHHHFQRADKRTTALL